MGFSILNNDEITKNINETYTSENEFHEEN